MAATVYSRFSLPGISDFHPAVSGFSRQDDMAALQID
jgi:hypothetical protein